MEERITALEKRVDALERQLQDVINPQAVADEIQKRFDFEIEKPAMTYDQYLALKDSGLSSPTDPATTNLE